MPTPTAAARWAERQRPAGLAVMRQRWTNLLFLHWAWDPAVIQATLPRGLTVDTHDGRAWLGLVPFFMRGVRPAFCPPVPGLSYFLELNVRTYVWDTHGRPGVWFYSLDANRWLAVKAARASFYLPYHHAEMAASFEAGGVIAYHSRRIESEKAARFRYRIAQASRECEPGTLEFFLVERYRLFAHDARRQRLLTTNVAHAPYQICAAEALEWDDGHLRLADFGAPRQVEVALPPPDHACAVSDVTVEIFPPRRVEPAA